MVVGIHADATDTTLLLPSLTSFKGITMAWTHSSFAIISKHWRLTWLKSSAINNIFVQFNRRALGKKQGNDDPKQAIPQTSSGFQESAKKQKVLIIHKIRRVMHIQKKKNHLCKHCKGRLAMNQRTLPEAEKPEGVSWNPTNLKELEMPSGRQH